MKLSFVPGELYVLEQEDAYLVQLRGQEILRTKSQRAAISCFNKIRQEMQAQFPDREPSPEEKKELLQKMLNDGLVGSNTIRKRKRSTARSTRTFG